MGTAYLTIIVSDGEIKASQYGNWDGDPRTNGAELLKLLLIDRKKEITTHLNRIVPIDDAEYQRYFKNGILDENALEKGHPKFWWRDGKDLLEKLLTDGTDIEIHNQVGMVNNSLLCDWAYVIDYDKNTFEVYRGFVKEPLSEAERFYNGGYVHENGYYPIRCTAIYSLDQLPSLAEFKSYDYENSYPYQDEQPVEQIEQKM